MPYSEKQRRAALAEVSKRKKGKSAQIFKGMGTNELSKYAKQPLEKKKKGKMSASEQADALRR